MRKSFLTFLILTLLLPAFIPLAPNSAVHALYDFHMSNHDGSSHHQDPHLDKFHSAGICFYEEDKDIPHHIPTDLKFYYKDILHIDLMIKDKDILIREIVWYQDFNFGLDFYIVETKRYTLRHQQERGPPMGHDLSPKFPSLYLTTLRFRI